ncbi:TRAP transporter small permease [Halomonas sp. McH1-25]|uniref:TRAP transporter small permease n=1 Tax=unclassified Halomonas TaxID=2609666 RepID=UPI001EF68CAC|nr:MULTISPECIES: TRAP transporter small permease [unclassified Halomonas]MCG7601977.1 TRAP transporter small permease [Halomonas sp. McH1-25]MCP1341582.1 TRAP transporter small permease [Halomonas sp. FL8]MCP1360228.1 TRAP transporter small permease [Halomonas sp. BBD45]MCP1366889.1 TRAP transporter small permease [Halomonas sp. BBD48]
MYRHLDAFSRHLATLSHYLGALIALIMVGTLLLGVFYRYVLQDSLSWSDEVALLAASWMTFLFASSLVRRFEHVRVTLILSMLPDSLAGLVERINVLLVLLFGLAMVWTGYGFMEFTSSQVSPAIRYPLWVKNAALPVGGALITIHAFVLLVRPSSLNALRAQDNG